MALLAACGGNPFLVLSDPVDPVSTDIVPKVVSKDMNAFSYTGGVLQIDMQGMSSSGTLATFIRAEGLDVPSGTNNDGYDACFYQETGLPRSSRGL